MNFNISTPSNSSLAKTQRLTTFTTNQKFLQVSPIQTNDSNKSKQLQVLKPVMNNKHNANKQDDSSSYRPAFGLRKLSAKINELSNPKKNSLLGKEENNSQIFDSSSKNLTFLNNTLNKNHLYSNKAVNSPTNTHLKHSNRSQEQGYTREKTSISTFYARGTKFGGRDQNKRDLFESQSNQNQDSITEDVRDKKPFSFKKQGTLAAKFNLNLDASGKPGQLKKQRSHFCDLDEQTSISTEMELKNMNENKQFKNNPLKEIHNQVNNIIGFQQKRKSLPFEIQPSPKLNNYFDGPFKISEKLENDHTAPLKFKVKEKPSENDERKKSYEQEKSYFEKKRRSDNTFKDKQIRLDEDILSNIYEKKESYRKLQNSSVTNTNSSQANTTASQHQKKSTGNSYFQSKRDSLLQSRLSAQLHSDQEAQKAVQNTLSKMQRSFQKHFDQIKSKTKVKFSLTKTEQIIRDLLKNFKQITSDASLVFIVKQHTRTHYAAYIFIRLLEEEMKIKGNDHISQIMYNVIDQISKNVAIFLEILELKQTSQKREGNNGNFNPFGVNFNHRNYANNKENIPRHHQTNSISKNEKKTKIKSNTQIALAYIKKLCRLNRHNQDRFKELLTILNQIECGASGQKKVKEEIKRVFNQVKDHLKLSINTHYQQQSQSQPRKSLQPRTKESDKNQTVELLEDTVKPIIQQSEDENVKSKLQIKRIDDFIKKIEKENSQPNIIEKPGRLTLQPQTFLSSKRSNQASVPQLSLPANKHQDKFQENLGPNTCREPRKKVKLEQNTDDVLVVPAPSHFNARSNSVPSNNPYLPSEVSGGLEYTLVLDLDETLVHFDPRIKTYRPRPGCLKFLHEMSHYYELVVFTAGLKDYADFILNDLDRQHYISHRLYRDHTRYKGGVYVKDLSKLGRDLRRTIIIDNIEENFCEQKDNGIPIKGWYTDPHDKEFERYAPFLKGLVQRGVQDIRPEVVRFKKQMHLHMRLYDPIHQHNEEKQLSSEKKRRSSRRNKSGDKENQNVNQQQQRVEYKKENLQENYTNKNEWYSDSEDEKKRAPSSEEEDDDEEEESDESPPKKKVVAKKEETSEEEEDDSDEESDDDKKKPPPKKNAQEEDSDEEDDEDEEESDEDSPPKKQTQKKSETDAASQGKLKELQNKVDELQEKLKEKEEELEVKSKDVQKLSDKMMSQDKEISELREQLKEKEDKIGERESQIEKLKEIQEGNIKEIEKLKQLIFQMDRFRIEYEKLEEIIKQKDEDMAVLRAKYYLDVVDYQINLVPEYPDMMDENTTLSEEIEKQKKEIEEFKKLEMEIKTDNYKLSEQNKEKEKKVKQLEREKENQMKKYKELLKKFKDQEQLISQQNNKIADFDNVMKKKNDELEDRLETMSKLIQKNEQLSQQLRVSRTRLEKFKKENIDLYQKQVNDRNSEIEVLKEMVKGIQLQVKSKEREIARLKQKLQLAEGQQLAARQQQNYMMQSSNANLPHPSSKGSQQRPQLGQIKHPGGNRYKFSQLQNSATRPAYPFKASLVQNTPSATYNDQVSNKSMSHSNNDMSQRQNILNAQSQDYAKLNESPRQQELMNQKKIVQDEEGEYGYSNNTSPMVDKGSVEKQKKSIKKNDRSSSFDIAQEVKKTVEGENNETYQEDQNQSNAQQRLISEASPEVFNQDSGENSGYKYQNNQEEAEEY